MSASTPSGPRIPTREAIEIMNQNAQAVAARSRWAGLVQAQQRVGRDALRRDRLIRTPTAEYLEQNPIPAPQPVPPDQEPPTTPLPTEQINNLVNQFQGTGGTSGRGNFIGSGGGGGGSGSRPQSGSGFGASIGVANGPGIETITNPNPLPQLPTKAPEEPTQAPKKQPIALSHYGPIHLMNTPDMRARMEDLARRWGRTHVELVVTGQNAQWVAW